ncbi:MAG: type II secretion system protein [Candidatus Omnitrophica bacterium]|nr:type II secretion system protein [Candidatus Omnitrophota bacterium]
MLKLFERKSKGFTLIELLVVISIIGILSSIVLISMGGAREKARDARRNSDIRQIGTALELYYTDIEAYAGASGSAAMPTAISTYMAEVPKDPKSAASYGWHSNTADTDKFCTWATLEGGGVIAASHHGVKELASAPGALSCW